MRQYRNSSQSIPNPGEKNNGKQLTQPHMAPPMRELLTRHALGIQDNVSYNGNFTGDLPDLRGIEPHDLKHLIHENQQKVKNLEELQNQQAVKLSQAKYEAKKKRDLELLKELQKQETPT